MKEGYPLGLKGTNYGGYDRIWGALPGVLRELHSCAGVNPQLCKKSVRVLLQCWAA